MPVCARVRLCVPVCVQVMDRLASGYSAIDPLPIPVPFEQLNFDVPAGAMYGTAANVSNALQVLAALAGGERTPLTMTPPQARDMLKPLWISPDNTFQQGTPWEMFVMPPAR